jgi:superfamily II DNA or RNA helicase/HKD family nuclease
MIQSGIYESLITRLLHDRLSALEASYYIERQPLDSAEAAEYLSRFLTQVLYSAFESLPNSEDRVFKQIELSNALVKWLAEYLHNAEFSENLLHSQGQILSALFKTQNPIAADLKVHVAKITPLTGLVQSELFTGSNVGLSLESEIKREILSADEICWLVSFIKWTGIRIFADVLKEVTQNGKKVRIITTSYMGATDQKAVDFLSGLPNTEVRLNYNTDRERLHAKAYLFLRKSGFDTGYIGSSNISRSALTNGLEWNLKVTTQEIPHIIEKFKSTFETYWASSEFEPYVVGNESHRGRLKKALQTERGSGQNEEPQFFFDIEPHAYQKEILEKLTVEREIHHRTRNLVVAATGTGKTIISAFDFKRFHKANPTAKFLFVAHREEILQQARATFRAVLRSHSFGELWVGGIEPEHFNQIFASVQTLNSRFNQLDLSPNFFDFIVIDEVHHIAAESYRPILNRFSPKILLGLTATPERHDGTDVREDFCGTIAAELRLPEAINQRHLCPFQYFGLDDPTDLSNVQWVKGRYLPSELTRIYTANDQRIGHILRSIDDVVGNIHKIKALAFCVSQDHAQFMAAKFLLKGVKSAVLTSANSQDRMTLREQLASGQINVLFVVDIFNEGVDIPEIDTVLFLRPTESLTVFLQQLGRGLRLSDGKDCLTVLDFVGNAREEYDFSQKFRALVGKSHTSVIDEIENDFPHIPLGCSIVLQKQAKETILRNIKNAIVNQRKLISYIRGFAHQTTLPLTLSNFLRQNPNVTIEDIYKNKIDGGGGWSRLCVKAGISEDTLDSGIEQAMFRGISNRLLQCSSYSYLSFILNLLSNNGEWNRLNEIENQFALMTHYDFWQKPGKEFGFKSLEESLFALVRDTRLKAECMEVVDQILDSLDVEELPMDIGFSSALQLHARYSRDEILAAFGENRFDRKSSSREGVIEIKSLNCELLFVTLQKTDKKFSPTTLYHDYAINEILFHWQSQNAARPDKGKGLSYLKHKETGKKILLFVREQSSDEFGRAMGFINVGVVTLESHSGSQPMNITWRLEQPITPYLWKSAAKLAVG